MRYILLFAWELRMVASLKTRWRLVMTRRRKSHSQTTRKILSFSMFMGRTHIPSNLIRAV